MKWFWVVMIMLILGTAAYLAVGRSAPPRVVDPSSLMRDEPSAPKLPGRKENDESAFFVGDEASAPAPEQVATKPPAPQPLPDPPTPVGQPPSAHESPESDPAPEVTTAPAPVATEEPKPAVKEETKKEEPAPPPQPPTPAPVKTPAATPPAPATPKPAPKAESGASTAVFGEDAKIDKKDDGSMLVDDKYTLKGDGTLEHPYEITWEYLVSAQENYQPRLGKKKLPGRLKLISGKQVRISGYIAFPVGALEQTEMLSMLNQWDGCCIGVPPSPYDAIEVHLKDAARGDERLATFGTVEGKLTVEPYLMRDWLVSLYSMEGATLSRAQ